MQQPSAPDPYRTLGVPRGASDAQIKAAHRALAKRYHPDAATGDTVRFLRVQEAYQVLVDPLRRREWDARHAPGPVRAGAPAQGRPRAANGRWTRSADASGPASAAGPGGAGGTARARGPAGSPPSADGAPRPAAATGRERPARGYTWSASEVPWWEDRGPRENRRQPGRQRPKADSADPARPASARPRPSREGTGQEADSRRGPGADSTRRADAARHDARDAPNEFDVYNRSSGAAWSSAARAYFRRAEAELPRRGSFQHEGTQPLTAARARVAAEDEARRRQWAEQRRGSEPAPPQSTPRRPRARPHTPETPTQHADRMTAGGRGGSPAGQAGEAAGAAQPAYAWAGVARGAGTVGSARSAWRRATRSSRWPTLSERLVYALIAWIPVAILIGYAGSAVTGCDRAAVTCPPQTETVQTVLIALSLGLLVALPRIAYTAAIATAAVALAAIAAVVTSWLLGFGPPLPAPLLLVIGIVLLVVYLATASWVLADGPRRRPWLSAGRSHWQTRR